MFFGSDFPASMMLSMNTNATVIFVPATATSCIMKDVVIMYHTVMVHTTTTIIMHIYV